MRYRISHGLFRWRWLRDCLPWRWRNYTPPETSVAIYQSSQRHVISQQTCLTFGITTLRKFQISPNPFPPKQVQITPLSLRQNMHQQDYGKTCTQVQHAGSTIRSEGFVSLQVFEERVLIACHIGITGYKWSICLLKWKSWQNWNGSVKYYYYYYYYWTKAYSCGNDYFIGNCIWRDFYVLRTKESRA